MRKAAYGEVKLKVKVTWIYITPSRRSRETSKALRHGSHSYTCKLQHACFYLVSVHQMALPLTYDNVRLIAAYYSSIDPERMKGWVGWPIADSLPITQAITRHLEVVTRESSPVKDSNTFYMTRRPNLVYIMYNLNLILFAKVNCCYFLFDRKQTFDRSVKNVHGPPRRTLVCTFESCSAV